MQLARAIRGPAVEVTALLGTGRVHARREALAEAAGCVRRALAMARAGEMRLLEGDALVPLADVLLGHGDKEQAAATAQEARDIHLAAGYRLGEALALHVLARAADSEAYRAQAAAILAEIGAAALEQLAG